MDRFVRYWSSPTDAVRIGFDSPVESAGDFHEEAATKRRNGKDGWPALDRALACCSLQEANLLVICPASSLDDACLLKRLRDSGARVIILDSPMLTKDALDALVWAAEKKTKYMVERSRTGLQLAKRNGVKLGNPQNLSNRVAGSRRGIEQRKRKADERAIRVGPRIETLCNEGCSYRTIAHELERQLVATERGGAWTAAQVIRVLARMRSLRNQPADVAIRKID